MEQNTRFRFLVNPLHEQQRPVGGFSSQNAWVPPTDVYETHSALVVRMAVPGIRTSDVGIRFTPGSIIVEGHRDFLKDAEMVAYHQMEIISGRFERMIRVQMALDPDKTTARYENGLLTIRIPKCKVRVQKVYTVRFNL